MNVIKYLKKIKLYYSLIVNYLFSIKHSISILFLILTYFIEINLFNTMKNDTEIFI